MGFQLIGSTGIIWNQSQTISHCVKNMFFVEMECENCLSLNSDWKDRSDWLADNNNLTSRASSSPTFVKVLCKGTISQCFVKMPYMQFRLYLECLWGMSININILRTFFGRCAHQNRLCDILRDRGHLLIFMVGVPQRMQLSNCKFCIYTHPV